MSDTHPPTLTPRPSRAAVDERRAIDKHTPAPRVGARAAHEPAPAMAREVEELLASIWLYIDWRYVTRNLTSEQRTMLADAVDSSSARRATEDGEVARPVADRWWDDSQRAFHPYCCEAGWTAHPSACPEHRTRARDGRR